jgi:hypothetical protein
MASTSPFLSVANGPSCIPTSLARRADRSRFYERHVFQEDPRAARRGSADRPDPRSGRPPGRPPGDRDRTSRRVMAATGVLEQRTARALQPSTGGIDPRPRSSAVRVSGVPCSNVVRGLVARRATPPHARHLVDGAGPAGFCAGIARQGASAARRRAAPAVGAGPRVGASRSARSPGGARSAIADPPGSGRAAPDRHGARNAQARRPRSSAGSASVPGLYGVDRPMAEPAPPGQVGRRDCVTSPRRPRRRRLDSTLLRLLDCVIPDGN